MSNKPLLSVVVPAYNEQQVIAEFYARLKKVLMKIPYDYEVIFVDDGSFDDTLNVLRELAEDDSRIRIIRFSKNFGHMIALAAGLDSATGDAVLTIDSDLQHPPELIPELLEKWQNGARVVSTIRKSTKSIGFVKKNAVRLFYWIFNRIAHTKIMPNVADFRLFDKRVVQSLKNFQERVRFLRGLVDWLGYKQEFVSFHADSRHAGKTKYSFFRMCSFALDGITSFSAFPLRAATYLGGIIAFFSSLYIFYIIYIKLSDRAFPGWASTLVVILFIGGIQLIFLGILGEYLARVYEETKKRPLYVVDERIGFN